MDHDALVALVDRAAARGAAAEVVSRAQEEVSELLLAHQDRLYGLCLRFVGDPERSLDLAKTAIQVGVRRLGEWRGEGSFWTWWYGVARDLCLRQLARKRNLLTTDGVLISGSEAAKAVAPMRREDWQELLRQVGSADLTADEQDAVYLRYVEGLEVPEITEVMQVQGTGARGLLQRSRHKLGLALRDMPPAPIHELFSHASWGELARVEASESTRGHLARCPQCRVDRRRLRHPMGVRARDLEAVEAELEASRTEAVRTLVSSWRSALSGGPRHDDASRAPLRPRSAQIGDYELDGLVSRSGAAVAYHAHHVQSGATALVRVLPNTDPRVRARLKKEVRPLRALRHPHLVPLLDQRIEDGHPVLITDDSDGPTLEDLLRHEVLLPLELVDTLAVHVLSGMAAAHAYGVVHRDLRTANVMIDVSDTQIRARVTGIAMARLLWGLDNKMAFGAPPYMAPEQLHDASRTDARSDVFSLGVVLYELATGQRCFAAADHVDAVQRVLDLDYVSPTTIRSQLPERMAQAIVACLKRDPDARPKSAAALLDLWTRGAGSVVRGGHSLTEGEAASYRYLRPVRPLPEPGSMEGDAPLSLTASEPPAVPDATVAPRGGHLVAFLGVVLILVAAAVGALWSRLQPPMVTGPIPWRMARAIENTVDPDLSPDGRTMLFSDQEHVYLFGAGVAQPTPITTAFPHHATDPAWSHDGRQVAFSAGGALWLVQLGSRQARFVAEPAYEPSWSPDGRHIVYVTAPTPADGSARPAALKTVDVAQPDEDRKYLLLVPEDEGSPMQPAYDPDGIRIAWASPSGVKVAAADGGTPVPLPGKGWDPFWFDAHTLVVLCEPAPGQYALCRFEDGPEGWRDPTVWLELSQRPRTFDLSRVAGRAVIGLTTPVHTTLHVSAGSAQAAPVTIGDTRIRGAVASPADGTIAAIDAEHAGRVWVQRPLQGWRVVAEVDDVHSIAWRPDGGRLTFSGTVDCQSGVFEILPTGGAPVPWTDGRTAWSAPFGWDPHGQFGVWTDRGVDPSTPLKLPVPGPWSEGTLAEAREAPLPGTAAGSISPEGMQVLVQLTPTTWARVDAFTGVSTWVPPTADAMAWWSETVVLVGEGSTLRQYDLETDTFTSFEVDLTPWTISGPTSIVVDRVQGVWISAWKEAGGLQRLDLPLEQAARR